ncbi:hypothetical protein ROZALSC1DRAFT_31776, partial [Rozella allomycis CSF55]
MDVDFKPENYSVPLELQFIQPNGIPKVLLGRTEQLKSIDAFMKLSNDKTRVISMGSTRGMGKTTMCKYLATKHENNPLKGARDVGRLIVYEMKNYTRRDPKLLWRDLIVHHLCYIFQGCTVDGIKFSELSMNNIVNGEAPEAHYTLVRWIENVITDTFRSITELIRLTSIAFGVQSNAKPTEVQIFLGNSTFMCIGQLTANCYAIVAGIVYGNLKLIQDGTNFIVRNIYLSPLSMLERETDNDLWPASFEEF